MPIPIQNIYYLLCYSWDKLEEKDKVTVSLDDKTELVDLFARILINTTKHLLKRGIDKSYLEEEEEIAGIKGKILFAETIKKNLLHRQKAFCLFENLSPNILLNRIIYSTISILIKTQSLHTGLKYELTKIKRQFPPLEPLILSERIFNEVRLNKNNRFYDFIVSVCQLVFENSFPSEKEGNYKFYDFTRDENKMNRVFESFLKNFYKKEQSFYKVKGEHIKWKFISEDDFSLEFLPQMRTDITLENETDKIIIDAKYYKQTLEANYGKEKIKSANLYQLFSYLLNQETDEKTKRTRGILLYPTIDQNYSLKYEYKDHQVSLETINLMGDWMSIRNKLLDLIS